MKKLFISSCFVILLMLGTQHLYAEGGLTWWNKASDFFDGTTNDTDLTALKDLENMILVVGNIVFFSVTTMLGVKYIWGSVESKASIKESLITLVVAAIFFYGYTTIKSIFIGDKGLVFVKTDFTGSAESIYSLIIYVCNYLAIGGIIYIRNKIYDDGCFW